MALGGIDGFRIKYNVSHAYFLIHIFPAFAVQSLLSNEQRNGHVNGPSTEKKNIFDKWEVNPMSAKRVSLLLSLSAAVFHYQCPNQLVKKSETQTAVLKITEFHHKCPALPVAALVSGLK